MNSHLYNESFTGWIKAIPQCYHCLRDTHASSACLMNANPSSTFNATNLVRRSAGDITTVYRHMCCTCTLTNGIGAPRIPARKVPIGKGQGPPQSYAYVITLLILCYRLCIGLICCNDLAKAAHVLHVMVA